MDSKKFDFETLESCVPDDIDSFFTKAELRSMCAYEKLRYRNMRQNYEMMLKIGLHVNKPAFMNPIRHRKRVKVEESDSDEDWTPSKENRKSSRVIKQTGLFSIPLKEKQNRPRSNKGNRIKKPAETAGRPTSDSVSTNQHTYPLRARPSDQNFMNIEVPDDDEFLYCEECNKEYQGNCEVHGPLHVIEDTQVSICETGDKQIHANKSIPYGLIIRESGIQNAGLGVWTESAIQVRHRFGPYKGNIITDSDEAHSSGYCWQIYKDGKAWHFIDAVDSSASNWMRYVNCARNDSEQNLTAYQFRGQIFYRSHKYIAPNTELLVWYGSDYGQELGIDRDSIYHKLARTDNMEGTHSCPCCRLAFSNTKFLKKHVHCKHSITLSDDHLWIRRQCEQQRAWIIEYRRKQMSNNLDSEKENMSAPAALNGGIHAQNTLPKILNLRTNGRLRKSMKIEAKHKRVVLQTGERPYECDVSGEGSTASSDLDSRMMIHSGERPFKCDVCGKGFTQSGVLNKHMRIHSGEKLYKCDVCGKGFSQSNNLDGHMRIHSGEKPYKCDVCGKGFSRSNNLDGHMRIHSGERPYKCDVCGKGFTWSNHLDRHTRIHSGERPYKCDVCGKGFTLSNTLDCHMRIHSGEKPYKCDVCGKGFSQSNSLDGHMRIHSGEKPYKCDVCGKGFTRSDSLDIHMRIHSGERPYKCDVCGKGLTQSGHLDKHMRIHSGEKPYKCDVCGKGFTRSGNLDKHMRIHSGEKPYKCDVCGKGFTQSGHLDGHMRIHSGEKPYKCDVCGKGFSQSNNLDGHMRIHSGERPYKCDVCGKGFTQSGVLDKHMRIHSGEKPYKCDVCGKGFTDSGNLDKHMRIHSGEKPYKCDVCGKGFTQSGNLDKHMRIHSGEKPYKCDVCGKGFTQSGALDKHMRIHSGEKPYKCDVCGKGFAQSGDLNKHMRIHFRAI